MVVRTYMEYNKISKNIKKAISDFMANYEKIVRENEQLKQNITKDSKDVIKLDLVKVRQMVAEQETMRDEYNHSSTEYIIYEEAINFLNNVLLDCEIK